MRGSEIDKRFVGKHQAGYVLPKMAKACILLLKGLNPALGLNPVQVSSADAAAVKLQGKQTRRLDEASLIPLHNRTQHRLLWDNYPRAGKMDMIWPFIDKHLTINSLLLIVISYMLWVFLDSPL